MGFLTILIIATISCSSDDSSGEGGNKPFNVKGDWKITIDDSYESEKQIYFFSTDEQGESYDTYGDVGYSKLSHQNNILTLKIKDLEGITVPAIDFNAPDVRATKFVHQETYKDENGSGVVETYTLHIELERLKGPGENPSPQPKSIEGVWKHSTQKYQIKIQGDKAIIYNLDEAGSQFPKKLLGDTFYDQISKSAARTWSATSYQWRFTDEDVENGRWVNEGGVPLTLSEDGNTFYQGTRTFYRVL